MKPLLYTAALLSLAWVINCAPQPLVNLTSISDESNLTTESISESAPTLSPSVPSTTDSKAKNDTGRVSDEAKEASESLSLAAEARGGTEATVKIESDSPDATTVSKSDEFIDAVGLNEADSDTSTVEDTAATTVIEVTAKVDKPITQYVPPLDPIKHMLMMADKLNAQKVSGSSESVTESQPSTTSLPTTLDVSTKLETVSGEKSDPSENFAPESSELGEETKAPSTDTPVYDATTPKNADFETLKDTVTESPVTTNEVLAETTSEASDFETTTASVKEASSNSEKTVDLEEKTAALLKHSDKILITGDESSTEKGVEVEETTSIIFLTTAETLKVEGTESTSLLKNVDELKLEKDIPLSRTTSAEPTTEQEKNTDENATRKAETTLTTSTTTVIPETTFESSSTESPEKLKETVSLEEELEFRAVKIPILNESKVSYVERRRPVTVDPNLSEPSSVSNEETEVTTVSILTTLAELLSSTLLDTDPPEVTSTEKYLAAGEENKQTTTIPLSLNEDELSDVKSDSEAISSVNLSDVLKAQSLKDELESLAENITSTDLPTTEGTTREKQPEILLDDPSSEILELKSEETELQTTPEDKTTTAAVFTSTEDISTSTERDTTANYGSSLESKSEVTTAAAESSTELKSEGTAAAAESSTELKSEGTAAAAESSTELKSQGTTSAVESSTESEETTVFVESSTESKTKEAEIFITTTQTIPSDSSSDDNQFDYLYKVKDRYVSGKNTDMVAAVQFLHYHDKASSEQCFKLVDAHWNYATNLTEDNKKKQLEQTLAYSLFHKEAWKNATSFAWKSFNDTLLRRWFKSLSVLGTAALPEDKLNEFNKIKAEMKNTYSTAKICTYVSPQAIRKGTILTEKDCGLTLEPDLQKILTKSRNYDELAHVWKSWRDAAGRPVREKYLRFVNLSNEAARLNGFSDTGDMWREAYQSETFESDLEKLWEQLKPLYLNLHAYVRRRLIGQYGADRIKEDGPIPAHLFGNMWAQSWISLLDITQPFLGKPSVDVTPIMEAKNMSAYEMFKISEEFFTSLGLKPMPEPFWKYSLIEKPKDREIICHASAWDFCNGKDYRIKQCTDITMDDLITVHHEMGHIQYFLQYSRQPNVFREGANPGFHEAIGDVLALSVSTPKHLKEIGLLEEVSDDPEGDLNFLLFTALDKVSFLPSGYLIDLWRWGLFSGEIKPEEMNTKWWELKLKYQGICPPVKRTDTDFDPGAKFHVPGNVPYIRYFVSFVIQFQFHKVLCDASGHTGPLYKCDIYKSREAGQILSQVMELGSSEHWSEAMKIMTGGATNKMDAGPILEYFEPLLEFLIEQNRNETLGWRSEDPTICP